jgi:hypothetical protein
MRTYVQAVAYAEAERLHPSQNWHNRCQKFARQCVGASAWATSALNAWNSTPSQYRRTGTPPAGSLVYFGTTKPGHVVFMVDHGYCYSTDILRDGKVDRVPWTAIRDRWNMRYRGYIIHTPSGTINLKPVVSVPSLPVVSLSHVQRAAVIDPPAAQGHRTYPADVALVEKALVRVGLLPVKYSTDGSYGTTTRTGMATWQRKVNSARRDGIPSQSDLASLGSRTNTFRVVA